MRARVIACAELLPALIIFLSRPFSRLIWLGWVVTGDALYAQKNLSRQVVEQGGDYFWVVKDNQPTLRADIALLFAEPPWGEELATAGECGRHGDRWEERTLWTSTALNEYLDWPQVRQVCCVERKVTRKGATRKELA